MTDCTEFIGDNTGSVVRTRKKMVSVKGLGKASGLQIGAASMISCCCYKLGSFTRDMVHVSWLF